MFACLGTQQLRSPVASLAEALQRYTSELDRLFMARARIKDSLMSKFTISSPAQRYAEVILKATEKALSAYEIISLPESRIQHPPESVIEAFTVSNLIDMLNHRRAGRFSSRVQFVYKDFEDLSGIKSVPGKTPTSYEGKKRMDIALFIDNLPFACLEMKRYGNRTKYYKDIDRLTKLARRCAERDGSKFRFCVFIDLRHDYVPKGNKKSKKQANRAMIEFILGNFKPSDYCIMQRQINLWTSEEGKQYSENVTVVLIDFRRVLG